MVNLIKYEFMKKYRMFTTIIIATVLANIYLTIKFGETGFGLLAFFLGTGLFVLYAVDVVKMYSQELNRKTGYMVFMTPNSGYKVIGSKIITALVEGFVLLLFFLAVLTLNTLLIYGNIDEVVIFSFSMPLPTFMQYLFIMLFAGVLFLVQFIMVIYTAITVSKSILSNSKYKGIISFGLFLLINYITFNVYWWLYKLLDIGEITGSISPVKLLSVLSPSMILSAVLCGIFVYTSGYLVEKKINL